MAIRIEFYVQPRASRTEVVGMHDGRIKVKLAAPPVEGAANAALVQFIATKLGIPKSRVRIVAGATARRKVIEVDEVTEQSILARLL
jgi:uncharacterized protein